MAGYDAAEHEGAGNDRPGFDRRSFVKRVAVGTAFAVPVITSFSMTGVNSAFAAELVSSNVITPNT